MRGCSGEQLSWLDIEAFVRMTGIRPTQAEAELLLELDLLARSSRQKSLRERAK